MLTNLFFFHVCFNLHVYQLLFDFLWLYCMHVLSFVLLLQTLKCHCKSVKSAMREYCARALG